MAASKAGRDQVDRRQGHGQQHRREDGGRRADADTGRQGDLPAPDADRIVRRTRAAFAEPSAADGKEVNLRCLQQNPGKDV
jgi:hypothetical protein